MIVLSGQKAYNAYDTERRRYALRSAVRRWCMFGDSVGKGVIYDRNTQRYSVTRDSFGSVSAGKLGVELDNFSRFGCTMTKGAEIIEKRLGSLNGYEAVMLEFGGNDCDFDWAQVAARPLERHECKTPLKQFVSGYIALIEKIRRAGGLPVLLTVPAVNAEKFFDWITRDNDSEAIMTFLKEKHRIEHWNELYNNAVWSVSAAEKVPVVDIRSPLLCERDFDDYFCDDGIHLNQAGHALIAEHIIRQFAPA